MVKERIQFQVTKSHIQMCMYCAVYTQQFCVRVYKYFHSSMRKPVHIYMAQVYNTKIINLSAPL